MVGWSGDKYAYIEKRGSFRKQERVKYKECFKEKEFSTWGRYIVNPCRDNAPEGTVGWVRCPESFGDINLNNDSCTQISPTKDDFWCTFDKSCFAVVRRDEGCERDDQLCGDQLPKTCSTLEDPFTNPDCKNWVEQGIITKDSSIKDTLESYCKKGDNINDKTVCSTDLKNIFPSSFIDIATEYCKKGGNILYKTACNAILKEKDRGRYDSQLDNFCSVNTDKPECNCWKEPNEEEKKVLKATVSGFKRECHRASCASSTAFKTLSMEKSSCPSLQICFNDIGVKGDVGGNSAFSNIETVCNQSSTVNDSNTSANNTDISNTTVEKKDENDSSSSKKKRQIEIQRQEQERILKNNIIIGSALFIILILYLRS